MLLDELKSTGNWLFRWRSYLPLLLLILALPALRDASLSYNDNYLHRVWEILCLALAFLGLGVRILTVGYVPAGTSGRNTLKQVASTLNRSGMYSLVRHPLYLGNFLIWLGVSLVPRCWWFTVMTVLIFWLYYERIMFAEEMFLWESFGETFRAWAAETPAFIPHFKKWVKPEMAFSLKSVISREYSTFFAIMVIFTLFRVLMRWFAVGALRPDTLTAVFLGLGLIPYATIRVLKKNTTWLRAEGR